MTRRLSLVLAVVALVGAACSSGGGDAVSVSGELPAAETPTDPGEPVEAAAPTGGESGMSRQVTGAGTGESVPTADAPGRLVDATPLDLGEGVEGYRVRYTSESLDGRDIEVTGFVVIPEGDAPDGGWPVLSWAHGTTGMADVCAPSNDVAGQELLWSTVVDEGYAFVATDYEGLGTPGLHPYIVGESEGRGVLDIVRAARELGDLSDRFAVWGHSQGGHGALFAAQIWLDWAPELDLVGVVAGAPPSQFDLLAGFLEGSDFQGYLVMTAAGLATAHPELALDDVLTPEAVELAAVLDEGCTAEVFAVFNPLPYEEIAAVDDPFGVPGWREALLANDTNQRPVPVPTLILHGGDDEQIPAVSSALLADQLCALDGSAEVERIVYDGFRHAEVVAEYAPDMFAWLADRFAGTPAPSGC